jgi:hypothetical protein
MDSDKAWYVFRYYSHLMNEQERAANRHQTGTIKATHGRSDAAAQAEAKSGARHLRAMLSNEPQVLDLASDGFQAFLVRTAERIIGDHLDKIALNCCPKCGRLARTPTARQCRFCRHDWHNETANSKPTSPTRL